MKRFQRNRQGLILLVVLGMLALFSLLTVTYVVFASQSKSTNLAMSRRYVSDSSSFRPVFEEAIKQLVRGTTDTNSELYGKSMFDDLYGANETANLSGAAGRFVARSTALTGGQMLHTWSHLERPMLLSGRFLRIPLQLAANVPAESDVLNGRVITFPKGEGPLSGLSFHIIRYLGDLSGSADPSEFASSYSITIDLLENDLSAVHNQLVGTGGGASTAQTGTLASWAGLFPQMISPPLSGPWAAGAYLCYETVGINPSLPVLRDPYEFFINAVPLNSHGIGVMADGSNQLHALNSAAAPNVIDPAINYVPTGLQPRSKELGNSTLPGINKLFDPDRNVTLWPTGSTRQLQWGDTDEPFDSADFATEFLAYRPGAAAYSGDIIPSFHRTALLNYLVNFKSPETYTEFEFWAVLRRIELATMRPLPLDIITPSGAPAFMDQKKVTGGRYSSHVAFNPTNASIAIPLAGATMNGTSGIPLLQVNIGGAPGSWSTSWNTPAGVGRFRRWLDSLMVGRWDVDNLASGVPDSIFMDAGLPLQRTPDGQLLKALVAYYVECMDGKLDVNAVGSTAQANSYGTGNNLFARPTAVAPNNTITFSTPFARGNQAGGNSIYLNQGLGYGSADISLRHLFAKPSLVWGGGVDSAELAYRSLLAQRYLAPSSQPGTPGYDAISLLNLREHIFWNGSALDVRQIHAHGSLPGLPMAVRGRASYAMDRIGNPFIHNEFLPVSISDNEYESRLISSPYNDAPYTLAEWERIYRVADADRTSLPSRLQQLLGESDNGIASSVVQREISPRTRHLIVPKLAGRNAFFKAPKPVDSGVPVAAENQHNFRVGIDNSNGFSSVVEPPSSFYQLINTIRQLKSLPSIPFASFQALFPVEFQRGHAFNVNRPFGNGADDDGNGQTDEPLEISAGQFAVDSINPTTVGYSSVPLDTLMGQTIDSLNLDPAVDAIGPNARYLGEEGRQLYARHLYCLAQLLVPAEYNFPSIDRAFWTDLMTIKAGTGAPAIQARQKYLQIRGKILAQWAANVVDYRDADAVMTRFPYDPDPFDVMGTDNSAVVGWFPQRDLSTDAISPVTDPNFEPTIYVAWGMEQPELLLTESLAFHDLRIRKDPGASPDRFDQFRIPQGSLFFELYCPRTTETGASSTSSTSLPGVPSGLYTTDGTGDVVLNVSKMTPATIAGMGAVTSYPVWRVYISNSVDKTGMTQTAGRNRTPNERLLSPAATSAAETTRFDLSYQLPASNFPGGIAAPNFNGLALDTSMDAAQRIPEPATASSRVVVFAPGFVPSAANTPGVTDPAAQVYFNRDTSPMYLHGNQYMVVGPRPVTYLGSETVSRTSDAGKPGNVPSDHRIELTGTWASMFNRSSTEFRTSGANVRPAVTMVAAANRPSSWATSPPEPNLPYIGISVSEPLPNATFYAEPDEQINSNAGSGFDTLPEDGYFDFDTATTGPTLLPFDSGAAGPLANWDNNLAGDGTPLMIATIGSNSAPVVQPGTAIDWSTAYLQRLADPDKPWHSTFNPYITVDWLSIDLTVFSGEELDTDITPTPTDLRLASRQKSGQMVNPATVSFASASTPGLTFLSPVTHAPREAARVSGAATFLKYDLKGDALVTAPATYETRPSTCDTAFLANDVNSFATLGFLNSSFVLAAESGIAGLPALPPVYTGAPGDPALADPTWYPSTVFWGNRPFVNGFELAYVPVSGPAQLGQEFSSTLATGTPTPGIYASAFRKVNAAGYPTDPRMPTTILSPPVPTSGPLAVTAASWTANAMRPQWLQSGVPAAADYNGAVNPTSQYPFTHLLNFFQEMPELQIPQQRYRNLNNFSTDEQSRHRHPKDTSLALLFDLVDTPSAWGDVENYEPSSSFAWQDSSSMSQEFATVAQARNAVFAPFRAPYNKLPRDIEPGRVNLNTVSEPSVVQGLWSNTLTPGDVDLQVYQPTQPFPQPNDVDHNNNGMIEGGGRTTYGAINATVWTAIAQSRRGYEPVTIAGLYTPPNQSDDVFLPSRSFNPFFPTHFAGLFKPASEAGMVPQTRNPIPVPAFPLTGTEEQLHLHNRAQEGGLLDYYARLNPTHVTLMRADPLRSSSADNTGTVVPVAPGRTGTPYATGLHEPSTFKLFRDVNEAGKKHPFTDLYPISRLQKLVSERSNVFAVYTTIGLFEYDEITGNIGKEYGVDNGEARRFKAFYMVDRSVPVGFRIGEDHNVEKTILIRRILTE